MSAALAQANDRLRNPLETGEVIVTGGVIALGPDFQLAALEAVNNDRSCRAAFACCERHAVGILVVDGSKLYWKIDVQSDPMREPGSVADASSNIWRTLTIMLPEEL